MEIYFLLLTWSLISAILCFFPKKNIKLMNRIYLLINFFPMIIVSGLRKPGVGCDSETYYNMFYDTKNWDVLFDYEYLFNLFDRAGRAEPFYIVFNQIIHIFTNSGQVFLFITGTIILIGFSFFIYKNSECVWISTFIFIGFGFYVETFNTIRQCFAVMILCNSYYFLKQNKKYLYCIFVLIASRFHVSSILFIPICFLSPINPRKFKSFLFIVSCVCLFVYLSGVGFLANILSTLFPTSRFLLYLFSPDENINQAHLLKVLYISFWVVLGTAFVDKFDKKENIYFGSIFLILASACTLLQCFQLYMFSRFYYSFAIYLCIFIPLVLEKIIIKNIIHKYIAYSVFFGMTFFYMYKYIQNINANFEYKLFF